MLNLASLKLFDLSAPRSTISLVSLTSLYSCLTLPLLPRAGMSEALLGTIPMSRALIEPQRAPRKNSSAHHHPSNTPNVPGPSSSHAFLSQPSTSNIFTDPLIHAILSSLPSSVQWYHSQVSRLKPVDETSDVSEVSGLLGPPHPPLDRPCSSSTPWLSYFIQGSASKWSPIPYPFLIPSLRQTLPSTFGQLQPNSLCHMAATSYSIPLTYPLILLFSTSTIPASSRTGPSQ